MMLRWWRLLVLVWLSAGFGESARFWHISDLHLDKAYSVKGDPNKMCHGNSESSSKEDLNPAGNYNCDSPFVLVKSIFEAMKRFEPNPDFVLWTGDSAPHNDDADYPYITSVTSWVFNEIKKKFDVPVVAALGNHDSYLYDSYADQINNTQPEKDSQYYKYLHEGGFNNSVVGEENVKTFLRCGYFTKTIKAKDASIKFVVLNTNLYYNNKISFTVADPCDQLQWLRTTLEETQPHEKVYLVAHVPPGGNGLQPGKQIFSTPKGFASEVEKQYMSLVTEPGLHEKIVAHFYGHLHTDTFRLFLSRSGDESVNGVGFIGSSGTPLLWADGGVIGVNPSMRLFDFQEDGSLKDYTQYGLILDKLDLNKQKSRRGHFVNTDQEVTLQSSGGNPSRRRKREFRGVRYIPRDRRSGKSYPGLDVPAPTKSDHEQSPTTPKTVEKDIDLSLSSSVPQMDANSLTTTRQPEETTQPHVGITSVQPETVENATVLPLGTEDVTLVAALNKTDTNEDKTEYTVEAETTIKPDLLGHQGENPTVTTDNPALDRDNAANEGIEKEVKVKAEDSDDPAMIESIASQFVIIYKASNAFQVKDLSISQMSQAYNNMVTDRKMFDLFYKHNTVNHPHGNGACNQTCFRGFMCTIKCQVNEELNGCLTDGRPLKVTIVSPDNASTRKHLPLIPTTSTTTTTTTTSTTTLSSDTHIPIEITISHGKHGNPVNPDNSNPSEDVVSKPLETAKGSVSSRVAGVFLGLIGAVVIVAALGFVFWKYRQRRHRDQEFLLTDSVFRYDGYSQLDDF